MLGRLGFPHPTTRLWETIPVSSPGWAQITAAMLGRFLSVWSRHQTWKCKDRSHESSLTRQMRLHEGTTLLLFHSELPFVVDGLHGDLRS